MRTHLHDNLYLRKFAKYLNLEGATKLKCDPFAIECPNDDAYVVRREIEEQVRQPLSQFVFGIDGSGKSTLFRILCRPAPRRLDQQRLVVPISLTYPQRYASMDSMRQGAQSVLSFAPLTHAIFDALWNDLVVHKIHCNLQFRRLHDNQEWLATFRQFYQNFRPHDHARSLDAWHLSWLDGLDKAPLQSSPETVLDDLIQFILTTHEYIDRTAEPTGPMRRYSSIEVLVDGTETLSCSSSGIEKLQRDAETICTYFHSHLVVKLFLDALPGCLPQLDAMPCVRRGLAQVVRLPAWTKEQLLALVAERLRAARPGEFRDNLNLADILPNEAIIASLRPNLSELIVQGALQIYQQDGSEDAPVHMLRLARNVVAAAAGCKTERYMPPLGTNEVRALITEYWTRR